MEKIEDLYRIYYCNKRISNNYIEKYFPVLKFCMKKFGICFEFNYKDLFREKNDNIYFLVYFKIQNSIYGSNKFSIGQILLKKYLITFNFDTKLIGFYDKNIKLDKNNKKYYEHDGKIIAIFIIALIIFLIIGFILGKKFYEAKRKKKANELDDDYEYKSHNINAIKSDILID